MNFDELKDQWKNELVPEKLIPGLNISLSHSSNAIDKVRKNMKVDFWCFISMVLIGLLGILILPHYFYVPLIINIIIWSFFLLFSILSTYFLFKFFRFYKQSYHLNYSMKDNLWWFYYELRSFIDFYYTFNIVTLAMGLSSGLSLGYIGATMKFSQSQVNIVTDYMAQMDNIFGSLFLVIMVVFMIVCMIGFHYLVKFMYGRHLNQLKSTLDLLRDKEEELDL